MEHGFSIVSLKQNFISLSLFIDAHFIVIHLVHPCDCSFFFFPLVYHVEVYCYPQAIFQYARDYNCLDYCLIFWIKNNLHISQWHTKSKKCLQLVQAFHKMSKKKKYMNDLYKLVPKKISNISRICRQFKIRWQLLLIFKH